MTKVNIALGLAVVALVITVYGLFGGHVEKALFGSTSCANITCLSGGLRLVTGAGGDFESDVAAVFTGTFTLGSSGTAVNGLNEGKCNIFTGTITPVMGAGEMRYVDCQAGTISQSALTGVTVGDTVAVGFATTTGATKLLGGLQILGASASSTAAGYITLNLYNASTSPVTLTAAATSSLNYTAFR